MSTVMTTPTNMQTGCGLKVTVLAGGPSAEREVSLLSGQAVAEALRATGHEASLADIGPDNLAALDIPADVIFPALHGTFGEDGALQLILEARGLRFVGSGSEASATAMDKVRTKQALRELKLNLPLDVVVTADRLHAGMPPLSVPVCVKPVDQGSSVATFIVRDARLLEPAVREVTERFGRAMVEQFIAGQELTVAVIGDEALSPICIRPKREFYDYDAKYVDDATEYVFDAGFSEGLLSEARQQSLRVFRALGCRHLGRVDWIVDRQGQLWFLEVNTIPGFTSHSLVPKAAAHDGVPFEQLVDRLVRMAAEATV